MQWRIQGGLKGSADPPEASEGARFCLGSGEARPSYNNFFLLWHFMYGPTQENICLFMDGNVIHNLRYPAKLSCFLEGPVLIFAVGARSGNLIRSRLVAISF